MQAGQVLVRFPNPLAFDIQVRLGPCLELRRQQLLVSPKSTSYLPSLGSLGNQFGHLQSWHWYCVTLPAKWLAVVIYLFFFFFVGILPPRVSPVSSLASQRLGLLSKKWSLDTIGQTNWCPCPHRQTDSHVTCQNGNEIPHKYIYKYTITNANTQIQVHKYKYKSPLSDRLTGNLPKW